MSNVQIPNLPSAIAASGDELIEVVQAGVSVKMSLRQLWYGLLYPTGLIGYDTGSTIDQTTSKTTGVVLDGGSGRITMMSDAMLTNDIVEFTVTNADFGISDTPIVTIITPSSRYRAWVSGQAAGSYNISVQNTTGSTQSDAVQLQVNLIKGSIV